MTDTKAIPSSLKGSYVTIGNFDGIHLGHRYIFEHLLREARRDGVPAILVTFEPHPKMVLHPEIRPFYLLTPKNEKLNLLSLLGFDATIFIPFDLTYAEKTAEEFIQEILWRDLAVKKVFIGEDYRFGKNKGGDGKLLLRWGERLGFEVALMAKFYLNGEAVSSTRIRKAILAGEVRLARELLGRPYNIFGRVEEGERRGRTLGFPTANIIPEKELIPARGVYAVLVRAGEQIYQGVMNVGTKPTFGDGKLSLEAHLFDFSGNLYGEEIEVQFFERIREEKTFPDAASLATQIEQDIMKAKKVFLSTLSKEALAVED